ncbi:hypothetical protein EDB83DRAFT_2320200 [Lactarius deliciosus]|nr:hypothetical protein EDB83DRAFT_2320200 [Lactarius deliciosus]
MAHFGLCATLPAKRRNVYVRDTLVASAARHTIQPILKRTTESGELYCSLIGKRATGHLILSAENPNTKKGNVAGPVLGHFGWRQAPGECDFRFARPSTGYVYRLATRWQWRDSRFIQRRESAEAPAQRIAEPGARARMAVFSQPQARGLALTAPALDTVVIYINIYNYVYTEPPYSRGYRYQEFRMRTPGLSTVPQKSPGLGLAVLAHAHNCHGPSATERPRRPRPKTPRRHRLHLISGGCGDPAISHFQTNASVFTPLYGWSHGVDRMESE